MTPYYDKGGATIYHGSCLDIMPTLAENSVDSIVTDPPYGLEFMGKEWDHGIPGEAFWTEALRVAKPGAHLLAFGGTRTYHRLACAIEDAGWEIRDCIMWVYGSGFPKSLDVSKAIDKAAGAERVPNGKIKPGHEEFANRGNLSSVQSFQGTMGGKGGFDRPWMKDPKKVEAYHQGSDPVTEDAKQWDGWGTALKPSYEPIIVARKPLEGTVAANTLKWGTGGINVDGCRVGTEDVSSKAVRKPGMQKFGGENPRPFHDGAPAEVSSGSTCGRFPANLIHDGSEEVTGLFPDDNPSCKKASNAKPESKFRPGQGNYQPQGAIYPDDIGTSAARFFYAAKADSSERRKSKHPTVKPLDLMRYLVRLVTPVGGITLDPFMGSGTTIEAARAESCKAIGIELSEEYCEDAANRLAQGVLF